MKKIALICVICLLFSTIPCVASYSNITAVVSDVAGDIVTISGNAPIDSVVTVMILNPGKNTNDIPTSDIDDVQFMKSFLSKAGTFSCEVKMNTGTLPNKKEGAFTILVNIDGKLVYSDNNFVFYSSQTKQGYVNDLKLATKEQLLSAEGDTIKLSKIFETFSLSNHELYKEADIEDLAGVAVSQLSRGSLSGADDVEDFLIKVLVLNAFAGASPSLVSDNEFKYTDIWAADVGVISPLYADDFVNNLRSEGKNKVINATLTANYNNAQFDDVFKTFKNAMLFNLIVNNASMGCAHIERYIITKYNDEYEAAGFNTKLLSSIKNAEEKTAKLDEFLVCGATTLPDLAAEFNKIMKKNTTENEGNNSKPSVSAPSGGGGGGGFSGGASAPSPTPTTTPATPTSEPDNVIVITFTDLENVSWASEAIEYLYKNKIINGRSETQFAPNQMVTRAELVKMIVEALAIETTSDNISFGDVAASDWFMPYIRRAAAADIITGDNGLFRPNDNITREDASLIMYRALKPDEYGELTFSDADTISGYAKSAVAAMAHSGYINGMGGGIFAPKETLTRAQAAQLIYNAITKGGAQK